MERVSNITEVVCNQNLLVFKTKKHVKQFLTFLIQKIELINNYLIWRFEFLKVLYYYEHKLEMSDCIEMVVIHACKCKTKSVKQKCAQYFFGTFK